MHHTNIYSDTSKKKIDFSNNKYISDVLPALVNSIKKPKRAHNLRPGHLKSLTMKMVMSKF